MVNVAASLSHITIDLCDVLTRALENSFVCVLPSHSFHSYGFYFRSNALQWLGNVIV